VHGDDPLDERRRQRVVFTNSLVQKRFAPVLHRPVSHQQPPGTNRRRGGFFSAAWAAVSAHLTVRCRRSARRLVATARNGLVPPLTPMTTHYTVHFLSRMAGSLRGPPPQSAEKLLGFVAGKTLIYLACAHTPDGGASLCIANKEII
jgi:hypothetical protein